MSGTFMLYKFKIAGLTIAEMELMTIGQAVEYISYYAEDNATDDSVRATQEDFDKF